MLKESVALVVGVILCGLYGKNLFERKTIILNSSRMKKLNGNIIKVDNRCYRLDNSEKCDKKEN
jgi:hypothetical protein